MATSQTDIKSQTIELSTEAFETFCEDISGMFDVDMGCSQQEFCIETVKGLNKRFKKLAAVNSVKSEGTLAGNFQIVFDKEGLFTLAGVIAMLPEQKILDNRKRSSTKEAEDISDAVGEACNMLVGSWDRVFREELEGHGHFVQTNTFIGNPWNSPEEKIGLAGDEEFLFVPYEMTIGSYPAFNCGVIFPKTIFGDTSVPDAEPAAAEDEKTQEEPKDPQDAVDKDDSKEPDTTGKNDSEESESQAAANEKTLESGDKTAEQPVETDVENDQETSGENQTEAEEPVTEEAAEVKTEPEEISEPAEPTDGTEPVTETKAEDSDTAASDNAVESEQPETAETDEDTEPATETKADDSDIAASDNAVESEQPEAAKPDEDTEPATKTKAEDSDTAASDNAVESEQPETAKPDEDTEPATGPVSETIQRMAQSSTGLPGETDMISLAKCAKDIMQKEVLWGNADDSVQQALTKMQQADAGYMMVGTKDAIEGIVSIFDIAAALSVYLKPMFAKWRRPIDDATLQIKIKWIMTRPVSTIKPDTSLTAIMENMRQSGLRCLPVADEQGNIAGLVTVFDIFKALLNTDSDISTAGKTPQAPSLV